jgi:hypothetical protein
MRINSRGARSLRHSAHFSNVILRVGFQTAKSRNPGPEGAAAQGTRGFTRGCERPRALHNRWRLDRVPSRWRTGLTVGPEPRLPSLTTRAKEPGPRTVPLLDTARKGTNAGTVRQVSDIAGVPPPMLWFGRCSSGGAIDLTANTCWPVRPDEMVRR